MKKEWGLIPKILNGEKTVESRWYKNKVAPWGRVSIGDILYFKDSGGFVNVKSVVTDVEQIKIGDNSHAIKVMQGHSLADLGTTIIPKDLLAYILNKKYAIFVAFDNVEKIHPFDIDKKGFGMQSAWLVCDDVKLIQK